MLPRRANRVVLALDHEAPLVDVDGWCVFGTSDVQHQHPRVPFKTNDSGVKARHLQYRSAGLTPANHLPRQASRCDHGSVDGDGKSGRHVRWVGGYIIFQKATGSRSDFRPVFFGHLGPGRPDVGQVLHRAVKVRLGALRQPAKQI